MSWQDPMGLMGKVPQAAPEVVRQESTYLKLQDYEHDDDDKNNEEEDEYMTIHSFTGPPEKAFWHGPLGRAEAEALLRVRGRPGSYLVRHSLRAKANVYSLSFFSPRGIKHFKIMNDCGDCYIGVKKFSSLESLVAYYSNNWLCHYMELQQPVKNEEKYIVTDNYDHKGAANCIPIAKGDMVEARNQSKDPGGMWWFCVILMGSSPGLAGYVPVKLLKRYAPEYTTKQSAVPIQKGDEHLFLHGKIGRDEARRLLMSEGKMCSFLVRESDRAGDYSISFRITEQHVRHFKIENIGFNRYRCGGRDFDSIVEVVRRYQEDPLGMDRTLMFPLAPRMYVDAAQLPPAQLRVKIPTPTPRLPPERSRLPPGSSATTRQQEPVSEMKMSMRGPVQLRSSKTKTSYWKRRFTVVEEELRVLKIFKREGDIGKNKSMDIIQLDESVIYRVHQSLFEGSPFVYQLCSTDANNEEKIVYLSVDTEDELEEWLATLRQYVANGKPKKVSQVREIKGLDLTVCDAKDVPKSAAAPICYIYLNTAKSAKTKPQEAKVANSGKVSTSWYEHFQFDDVGYDFEEFTVELATLKAGKDKVYDKVVISLQGVKPNDKVDKWYAIGETSIRLQFTYTHEHVLPEFEYDRLKHCLLKSVLERNSPVLMLFNETTKDAVEKAAISRSLCKVYHKAKQIAPDFLTLLNECELLRCEDPNTIFRGNSLATKAMDQYMKMIAMKYLNKTLLRSIEGIFDLQHSMELDVMKMDSKLSDSQKTVQREHNLGRLKNAIVQVWGEIYKSAEKCPIELRRVFQNLRQAVHQRQTDPEAPEGWKTNTNVKYSAVSGFIFLRLFMPAIMGPKLFNMMPDHPSDLIDRNLKLIAKCMQNLANLSEFGGQKEPYMLQVNDFIKDHLGEMRDFLDRVSTVPRGDASYTEPKEKVNLARELQSVYMYIAEKEKQAGKDGLFSHSKEPLARELYDAVLGLQFVHKEFLKKGDDLYATRESLLSN